MPIPSPKPNEKRDDFISRCMESLKDEKKSQKQKLAICYTTYKRKKATKGGEEPTWEDAQKEPIVFIP